MSFIPESWKLEIVCWRNPRQSEEGWQQSNLVPRKVRPFFGLCLVTKTKAATTYTLLLLITILRLLNLNE